MFSDLVLHRVNFHPRGYRRSVHQPGRDFGCHSDDTEKKTDNKFTLNQSVVSSEGTLLAKVL